MSVRELGKQWDRIFTYEHSHWACLYAVLPHLCKYSNRIIWPGTKHYVKITEHKFTSNPPRYTWVHRDEFVFLKLKGEL